MCQKGVCCNFLGMTQLWDFLGSDVWLPTPRMQPVTRRIDYHIFLDRESQPKHLHLPLAFLDGGVDLKSKSLED